MKLGGSIGGICDMSENFKLWILVYCSSAAFISCDKQNSKLIEVDGYSNGKVRITHLYPDSLDTNYYNRTFYYPDGLIGTQGS